MTDQIKDELELDEAKATGEDSVAADATTPAGGSNTKRKQDKTQGEKPHSQGSSNEKTPEGPNDTGLKESEEVNVMEQLFDGEELSEEFKTKTVAIFEAAVHEKVTAIKAELEEKAEADLAEQTEAVVSDLVEKVDQYLDYVVENWMKANEVEIESNIKVEVAESLFDGIKGLVAEHNIDIDDEQVDVVADLEEKVEEANNKYNEKVEELIAMRESLETLKRDAAFKEVAEGLTDTQVEKLRVLAEGVSFETSEQFEEKLSVIKESYFKEEAVQVVDETENLMEEAEAETEEAQTEFVDPTIAAYADMIGRTAKK